MTSLLESIFINAAPDEVFRTLLGVLASESAYKKWHGDHQRCRWLEGNPFEQGSVLYVEEVLHGKLHRMKLVCTLHKPGKALEFRLMFPVSVIFPKGAFYIKEKGGGSVFTASLTMRSPWLLTVLASSRVEAVKEHIREEAENLKKLIEQKGTGSISGN